MIVGPYSPRRIDSSRTVPTVLTRHLQSSSVFCSPRPSSAVLANYLYGTSIPCRARPSSGITRQVALHETPAGPATPSRAVRLDGRQDTRPSRAPSRALPSVPSGPEEGRTGCLGTLDPASLTQFSGRYLYYFANNHHQVDGCWSLQQLRQIFAK